MRGSGEGRKGLQCLVEYSYWISAGLEFQLDTWNFNDLVRGIQTSCLILQTFCNCLQLDHSHISVPFLLLGCPRCYIAFLIFLPQHVLETKLVACDNSALLPFGKNTQLLKSAQGL